MSCLTEIIEGKRTIIGIADFDACDKSESGLNITDFPFITLKKAANTASDQFQSGGELLKKCVHQATKLVFNDFIQKINGYFDYNAVIETRDLHEFDNTKVTAAPNDKGLILKRWRSEAARIFVEELYLKVDHTGNVVITIEDGDITKSYQVAVTAGVINNARINYIAKSEHIRITMDTTNYDVYSGTILHTSRLECGSCALGRSIINGLFITGWDGAKENPYFYGMGILASVRCYEEVLICQLLPRMYFILWYKAAIMFVEHYMYSDRLNYLAKFSDDDPESTHDKLTEKYDKEYEAFVKMIPNYLRSTKGECITCNKNRNVQTLP